MAIMKHIPAPWPDPTTYKDTREALTTGGCQLPVYDAEKRACSMCLMNQECAQASIYYLRDAVEPRIREKYYHSTYTLDEAVVTVQQLRMFETLPKKEYTPEEVSDLFKTHDPVLIEELIKKLRP